ncbi:class II aldolase/adducin family protein [Rhodococcus spelaei]|uniref:Class II aldolase/adducin family protein n=1 Tax=Rhodococcus spelaei TaxID=2546320 RepID=A0A541BRC3_9NOCA|nr:class II aldolase/adducin family protein [Rhodococcus spelaei]TQF74880.1 class II aldolase/adducin family protein [Rhodococcus spelaei]
MSNFTFEQARTSVATVARELANEGLVLGSAGNVSVRLDDRIAVTATGARFETLTPEQVTLVDLDGRVVDGELAPTSELDLHLEIYRRYGAGAVVHTHAPTCVAVTCVTDELPVVHYQMLTVGGAVKVAPFAPFGSAELADYVAEALEGKTAALLANHGTVTYGADLTAAMDATRLLEWAATVYWRARSMGEVRTLDEQAQAAVIRAAVESKYGSTRPS